MNTLLLVSVDVFADTFVKQRCSLYSRSQGSGNTCPLPEQHKNVRSQIQRTD